MPSPSGPPPPPPLTEFSPEVAALATAVDRLNDLIRLTASANSGKRAPHIPPYPRPVTAAERVRRRRRYARHKQLTARLIPDRD